MHRPASAPQDRRGQRPERLQALPRQAGITVLEVLIAVGLLAVLISFASPSLSGAAARAEFKASVEHMELNLRIARNAARQNNTTVTMHLNNADQQIHHSVTYSMEGQAEDSAEASALLAWEFPESVRIRSSAPKVRFDFRGVAEESVQLELVSLHDDDLTHRFLIN